MEVAGLCLAAFELLKPLFKSAIEASRSFSAFGEEADDIRLRVSVAARQNEAFQIMLFDLGKFPKFKHGLFMEFDPILQQDVYDLLQKMQASIQEYLHLVEPYNVFKDSAKSAVELPSGRNVFMVELATRLFQADEQTSAKRKLTWALRDKKRVLRLVGEIDTWTSTTRWLLQDVLITVEEYKWDKGSTQLLDDRDNYAEILPALTSLRRLILSDRVQLESNAFGVEPNVLGQRSIKDGLTISTLQDDNVILEKRNLELDTHGLPDDASIQSTRRLTALLCAQADPEFATLQAVCYIHDPGSYEMLIVYRVPPNLDPEPISLRSLFSHHSSSDRPQLEDRFRLAYRMTRSIFLFHSMNWLHKNLRSENIYFLPTKNRNRDMGDSVRTIVATWEPKIFGFEYSRRESDLSYLDEDQQLSRNIYRHPQRWGNPTKEFQKVHEMYALGALLLEIGLWQSLESLDRKGFAPYANQPYVVKKILIEHATKRLGYTMGSQYQEIVLRCLNGDAEANVGSDRKTTSLNETGLGYDTAFKIEILRSLVTTWKNM